LSSPSDQATPSHVSNSDSGSTELVSSKFNPRHTAEALKNSSLLEVQNTFNSYHDLDNSFTDVYTQYDNIQFDEVLSHSTRPLVTARQGLPSIGPPSYIDLANLNNFAIDDRSLFDFSQSTPDSNSIGPYNQATSNIFDRDPFLVADPLANNDQDLFSMPSYNAAVPPFNPQPTPTAGIISCISPTCATTFSRIGERDRHFRAVHQRIRHHCGVIGCEDNKGQGYCRSDKLKEHIAKRHGL